MRRTTECVNDRNRSKEGVRTIKYVKDKNKTNEDC